METTPTTNATNQDDPKIIAWRARYQRYLRLLEDYYLQRTDFEQQRQVYHHQRLAYEMMREDLQQAKLEQEQRRRLTRRSF